LLLSLALHKDKKTVRATIEKGADANGGSPLTWTSKHLKPVKRLKLFTFEQ